MDDATLERHISELNAAGKHGEAIALLFQERSHRFLRYLRPRVRNQDLADVHAEFWENLLQALPAFEGKGSLHAWAARIALNTANNYLRRRYRKCETLIQLAGDRSLPEQAVHPSTARPLTYRTAGGRGPITRLRAEVSELEWNVYNHLAAGKSPREVAAALGVSPNTVYEATRRMRERGRRIKRWRT